MRRVAIVNPRRSGHVPLSCLFLASWWRERGHYDVVIVDANWDDPVEVVAAGHFDWVGVSAITPDFESAKTVAAAIHRRTSLPVTLGGIHATVLPESGRGRFACVHRGDGEGALPGSAWTGSLRSYPALRWDLLDRRYFRPQFKDGPMRSLTSIPLVTSRGCPFHCTFCAAPALTRGVGVRSHTVEWTVNEFAELADRGADMVCVFDDNFTLSADRLKRIADLKRERHLDALELTCNARVTHFDDRVCEQLVRLNATSVLFGWESGSERTLKRLKQDSATVEQAYESVDRARRFGLNVVGSVILGTDGETEQDMMDTARFAYRCGRRGARTVFWSALIPYPGSDEWRQREQAGLVSPDMDFDTLRYGSKAGVPRKVRIAMALARVPMLLRKIVLMLKDRLFSGWTKRNA